MIALLLGLSLAWEVAPGQRHDVPRPLPSDDPSFHGVVDLGNLVIVRPQGTELQQGFTTGAFSRALEAGLGERTGYDFAAVMHSDQLPTQFDGAAAFSLTYNNVEQEGVGKPRASTPHLDLKCGLWMSYPSYWDSWGEGVDVWVFGQELGHYWLAFPLVDLGAGPEDTLLGRAGSHWSWFADTPSSPMEGNRWIDHGDGSFTTDPTVPFRFSPMDLYLMGLLPPDQVPPMFLIQPDPGTVERVASSAPEFLVSDEPITITGTRVDYTVDDVIAAEGPHSTPGTGQRDFTILPVLVVGPEELITDDLVERTLARFGAWETGWTELTEGLSTASFAVKETDRQLPPPQAPLFPRGAW